LKIAIKAADEEKIHFSHCFASLARDSVSKWIRNALLTSVSRVRGDLQVFGDLKVKEVTEPQGCS
jgi:hypothetical protein